jgi:hypothetical protein
LDSALAEARRIAHTGNRIFVISDFMTYTDQTTSLLGALARSNSVSALRIQDPLERSLPASGRFAVAGSGGPIWFDAGNAAFQRAWKAKVDAHEQQLDQGFRTAGVPFATMMTAEASAVLLRTLLGPGGRI